MKKYLITKTTLIYEDGSKDFIRGKSEVNDLHAERKRLRSEFGCKLINFSFQVVDLYPKLKPHPIEERALDELTLNRAYLRPGIKSIDECIADAFGTTVENMKAQGRKEKATEARQFAMWYQKSTTKDSLASIGGYYGGRDHATVLHAVKTVENLRNTNKEFREKYDVALEMIERIKNI